ncbi:hypothetical protein L7F22_043365 [Adiantum nelumboides]|nr:hypothetical protein [Adiantum nelumboides]
MRFSHKGRVISESNRYVSELVIVFIGLQIGGLRHCRVRISFAFSMTSANNIRKALCFLILNFIMSSLSELNFLKEIGFQTRDSTAGLYISSRTSSVWQFVFDALTVHVPLLAICYAFVKNLWGSYLTSRTCTKVVFYGVPYTYAAICLLWLLDDFDTMQSLCIPGPTQKFARLVIPRTVYSVVVFQFVLLLCSGMDKRMYSQIQLQTLFKEISLALVAVFSGLILLLLGRHGPIVAVTAGLEAWCILEKQSYAALEHCQADKNQSLCASPQQCDVDKKALVDYLPATVQWSLFSVQVFFCTGHRCTFDGLRYAAAFIGFDHFNIYRQGTLLALDTYGASHILSILSLPLLVSKETPARQAISFSEFYRMRLSQALLMFQLVRTITTTFTTLCVTIQRRHLMVWGLFAPKYVFDAIGLLVTDIGVLFEILYVMWTFLH